jgi:hypothetical protein
MIPYDPEVSLRALDFSSAHSPDSLLPSAVTVAPLFQLALQVASAGPLQLSPKASEATTKGNLQIVVRRNPIPRPFEWVVICRDAFNIEDIVTTSSSLCAELEARRNDPDIAAGRVPL